MIEKLLHTPEGVRDLYNVECKEKIVLEKALRKVIHSYGYHDIETPTYEFFDVFNSDTGTVSSREMFKFFDRYNNTLVLRPDMTPSIARSVAKYYSDCSYPLRLTCRGNTFINQQGHQGKLAEGTEVGTELINDNSAAADAESIIMMIDCFLASGLRDFCIDIGQVEFYKGIMDAIDISDEVKQQIHEYVENKNSLGMEMLVSELELPSCYEKVLLEYNELYGGAEMLSRAKLLTDNKRCIKAVERLEAVYEVIKECSYEKYVSFDLGMVNHFDYYTGVIFRGYTYGTGDAIGKGGRYDSLLSQFGKEAAAIGFSIPVHNLLTAIKRQGIGIDIVDPDSAAMIFGPEDRKTAYALAMKLRRQGEKIEMFCLKKQDELCDLKAFAREQGAVRSYYIKGQTIETENLLTGEVFDTDLTAFDKGGRS